MGKNIFVLSGAGISKESGIPTFRDCKDGLWHNYKIDEVASPVGWRKNPQKVLNFYNERRTEVQKCVPNDGHYYLAKLQDYFNVNIYTQNVDDLHERAGSKNVFHLHGNITQARSVCDDEHIVDIGYNDIKLGDKHTDGGQLRPHIVFFNEFIYFEDEAAQAVQESDIVIAIGTSLCVYPAAQLPLRRRADVPFYIVDPSELPEYVEHYYKHPIHIKQPASIGMKELYDILVEVK